MHFSLLDRELERTDSSITTLKHISSAEEYLQDHFPSFPVLPGVMMLEAMTQAARSLIDPDETAERPWVLGAVRALKYGSFVRPGSSIRVRVREHSRTDNGIEFRGDVRLIEPAGDGEAQSDPDDAPLACIGRFEMRPVRRP